MIVRCTSCDSAFAVDDEKVDDKKFAFTCPKCSAENVVDNRATNIPVPPQAQTTPPVADEPLAASEDTLTADMDSGPDFDSGLDSDFDMDLPGETSEIPTAPDPGMAENTAIGDIDSFPEAPIEESPVEDFDSAPLMDESMTEELISDEDISSMKTTSMPEMEEDTAPTADISIDENVQSDIDFDVDNLDLDIDEISEAEMPSEELTEASFEGLTDSPSDASLEITSEEPVEFPDVLSETPAEPAQIDDMEEINLDDFESDIENMENEAVVVKGEPETSDAMADFDTDELPGAYPETGIPSEEIPDMAENIDLPDDFEPLEEDIASTEPSSQEMLSAEDDDESITIDLDSLDIELEEDDDIPQQEQPGFDDTPEISDIGEMDLPDDSGEPIIPDELDLDFEEPAPGLEAPLTNEVDEDITLDIDSLDIDLVEEDTIQEGEKPDDFALDTSGLTDDESAALQSIQGDEENITLDLDSLDIPLAESDEVQSGEVLDDDEKLTLEDTGLTFDELTAEEATHVIDETPLEEEKEEDIKLTIDEIDPSLSVESLETEFQEAETILSEDKDELSEIDFDEYEDDQYKEEETIKETPVAKISDEVIDLKDEDEYSLYSPDEAPAKLPDLIPRGTVNFSIDYSLKYSRIGAILRLTGLFFIGLIPHLIVFFLYNILSLILGFINHIVVISTSKTVEDFSEFQENTIRYMLSISASSIGIVEEMPIFAGKKNIDYALQMNIIYSVRYSKLLAFLRLSIVGIILFTLPHLLILSLITLTIPFIFLAGIFSVLATGRWPHVLFNFLTSYYRYLSKIVLFIVGLVDSYPPFKFQ